MTVVKNILGEGTLDSIDLEDVSNSLLEKKSVALSAEKEIQVNYNMVCQEVRNISWEIGRQPYLLQQFEQADSFSTKSPIETIMTFQV